MTPTHCTHTANAVDWWGTLKIFPQSISGVRTTIPEITQNSVKIIYMLPLIVYLRELHPWSIVTWPNMTYGCMFPLTDSGPVVVNALYREKSSLRMYNTPYFLTWLLSWSRILVNKASTHSICISSANTTNYLLTHQGLQ